MANIKSQIKRNQQNEKRRLNNRNVRGAARTAVNQARAAFVAEDPETKEAVLKVLGTGWRGGIAWTDIEILPEPSGQPRINLTGECSRIAGELGITRWLVSISHIETHATASAIGVAE